jgi:purine nucleoside permease
VNLAWRARPSGARMPLPLSLMKDLAIRLYGENVSIGACQPFLCRNIGCRFLVGVLFLCVAAGSLAGCHWPRRTQSPIPVKVVIVAMFEAGRDTGDKPGELQYWVERDHLDTVYSVSGAFHAARMNDDGELAIVTGPGTAHAAATIMALGLDPRFDLSNAYWLIAGIAGGSPQVTSLGSAVWANWVVDGDLRHQIDEREMPAAWQTGSLPLRKQQPFEEPVASLPGQVYQTNPGLTTWAYELTKDIKLQDTPQLMEIRSHFEDATAHNPPQVLLGDEVSSSSFWHGKRMDAWAVQWMTYFTKGNGHFATTAMEDSGTLQSLQLLSRAGRANWNRVLVLRTIANFDQQPMGMDAASSLASLSSGRYGAELPALESAYATGHIVVETLMSHWNRYRWVTP